MSEPGHNSQENEHDKEYREQFGDKAGSAQSHGTSAGAGDPLIGQRLTDDYLILDRLGAGSMAIVYKARQLKSDRIVAMKTLKERDPAVMERFYREVQTLSKLKHNNVVEAFDCIRTESGQTFLVMEFLDGVTLDQLLKTQGRVEKPADFASVIDQICAALEHAHQQRIIHRDLKPANIVLVRDARGGIIAKVLDFGIAKLQDDLQKITSEGQAVGSPMYMSPEQCMGHDLTPAADVYSLGILSYQMITGSLPYEGAKIMQIMAAHCNPDFWPKPISEVRPELPGVSQLNQIIFKALDTNVETRFRTVTELRKAMSVWLQAVQKGASDRPLPEEIALPQPTSGAKERVQALHDLVESKRSPSKKASAKSPKFDVAPKTILLLKVCSFAILAVALTFVLTIFLMQQDRDLIGNKFLEAARFVSNLLPSSPPKEVVQPVTTESDSTSTTASDSTKSSDDSTTVDVRKPPVIQPGAARELIEPVIVEPRAIPRPNYYQQDDDDDGGGRRL